jgi:hypothetical protein
MNFSILFPTYIFPAAISLVGAIFGAWLSIMWPIWRGNRIYRRETDLLGTWHSSWFDPSNSAAWLAERVVISVDHGKIVLVNQSNTLGYTWEGGGDLYDRRYFYGIWRSTKPGSHSSGVFSFFILPQGDAAVGQGMGPDRDGRILRFDWALGKNEEALQEAKAWIGRHNPQANSHALTLLASDTVSKAPS